MEAAPHPWPALGVLLLRDGFVTTEDLEQILADQRDSRKQRLTGWRLGEILVERGVITQDQVAKLVAEQYELPFVDLDEDAVDPRVASRLPDDLVERFSALPIEIQADGALLLAVADPAAVLFSDELRRAVGMPLRFAVAAPAALKAAIVSARARATQAPQSFDSPTFALVRASADSYLAHAEPGALADADSPTWPPLGALLVRDGLVSEEELETALAQQRLSSTKRLGEILVERGSVTRTAVARIVAEQYELPFIDLVPEELDARIGALLPDHVAQRYSAVPVRFEPDGSLLVAVADPTKVLDPEEILEVLGARFTFAVADPDAIEGALLRQRLAPAGEDEGTETDSGPEDDEPVADASTPEVADAEHATVDDVDPTSVDPADVEAVDEDAAEAPVAFAPAENPPDDESLLVALAPLSTLEDAWPAVASIPLGEAGEHVSEPNGPAADVLALVSAADTERAEVEVTPDEAEQDDAGAVATGELGPEPEPEPEAAEHPWTVAELLERGRTLGASSVHFSPQEERLVVRARVEGTMQEVALLGDDLRTDAEADLRRLAEAQDAGVQVAVLPTRHGDSFAVQLPENRDWAPTLAELALPDEDEASLREALAHTSGLVLVVGPPGSGRTTTLYAAFGELEPRERALVTVESPVHRPLPEVDQVAVDERFDGDVARAFSTALAVDPDVVLVDEVTGTDLARGTVEAAPGRLVLTTLEALSPGAAVRRLEDLGVPLEASLRGLTAVVTQRLVRRLCTSCRESYFATPEDLAELGRPKDEAGVRLLARGKGCRSCVGTGYRGRVGIISVLVPGEELAGLVSRGGEADGVAETLETLGAERLLASAVRLCLDGVTTAAEALKAISPPDRG